MTKCSICKTTEVNLFGYDKYRCKPCLRDRGRFLRGKNPDPSRKAALKYYWKNRSEQMGRNKRYEEMVKDSVFNNYGGYICSCCGEKEIVFLTIDHIDGGGTKHRKKVGGGGKFTYRWIYKNNFPKGFRVLCYNCNSGRARNNGICPHEKAKNNN